MFDAVVHPVPSPQPSKRPPKAAGERIYAAWGGRVWRNVTAELVGEVHDIAISRVRSVAASNPKP